MTRKPMENKTILIVDDEPTLGDILSEALSVEGYATIFNRCCASARETLANKDVNLVLLDALLPTDGELSLLEYIKMIHPQTPILMMTGCLELTSSRAISQGATDLLTKPFDLSDLYRHVKRALD